MSYTLVFTDSYKKRAKRFARQHPELRSNIAKPCCCCLKIPIIHRCACIP